MKQTRRIPKYHPKKYYAGLTRKKALNRKKEIEFFGSKDTNDPKAYSGFKTDSGVKTKPSSYTKQWDALFPHAKSLEERAKVTGVPLRFIKESFSRGLAAWRTGHRPGATQHAWGYARVSSFLLKGKTYNTADSDLVRKAKEVSASARSWWKKSF